MTGPSIWAVAQALGFECNPALSRNHEVRCGAKGSVSFDLRMDRWYDHEAQVGGDAVALAMYVMRCGYREAFTWLEANGLRAQSRPTFPIFGDEQSTIEDEARRSKAWSIFASASPLTGSCPASQYLNRRAIPGPFPPSLRFAYAWNTEAKLEMPALVAAVTFLEAPHEVRAVHRTYLHGSSKAALAAPKKALGPISGAAVVLGAIQDAFVVCEGIETGLSAGRIFSLPAVATLGVANMRRLDVPFWTKRVVIAFDRDPSGAGEHAARELAERLAFSGIAASLVCPPAGFKDFNDYAQALPGSCADG